MPKGEVSQKVIEKTFSSHRRTQVRRMTMVWRMIVWKIRDLRPNWEEDSSQQASSFASQTMLRVTKMRSVY